MKAHENVREHAESLANKNIKWYHANNHNLFGACFRSSMDMYHWLQEQIAERASKWIDNNINYNTDDEVSRTKKKILKESLLKTIQL